MRAALLSFLSLGFVLLSAGSLYATDLSVTKTADQETAAVGDTITFTIVVDNTSTFGGGPLDSSVDLFDRFTSGLMWIDISGDITAADCEAIAMGDGFDCRFDMEADEVKTATVTFVVTEAGEQSNAVSATPTIGDPDPSNNEAEATLVVTEPTSPSLQVRKSADIYFPEVGEDVTFTITVENTGDGEAIDVEVIDDIYRNADALSFLGAEGPFHCEQDDRSPGSDGQIRCSLESLPPETTLDISLTFRVLSRPDAAVRNDAGAAATNHERVDDEAAILPVPNAIDMIFLLAARRAEEDEHLDVYVDNSLVAGNVESGTGAAATSFSLGDVSPNVHVVPAGGELGDAVLAEQVDFFTGERDGEDFMLPDRYAIISAGPEQSPTLLIQRDARFEATDPAAVDVFFAHAAADAPGLDLRLSSGGLLVDDLGFGSLTDYASLLPAVHDIEVVDPEGEVLDVFKVDLSDRAGEGLGVVAVPPMDGAPGTVALAVLDRNGDVTRPEIVTAAPTLSVTKTADTDAPVVGDLITYTLTVENTGSAVARNVILEDNFGDRQMEFIDSFAGCKQGDFADQVRCSVGDLDPGASFTADVTFAFTSFYAGDLGVINQGRTYAENHEPVTTELNLDPEGLLIDLIFYFARAVPGGGKRAAERDVYVDSVLVAGNLASGMGGTGSDFALATMSPYVHIVPAGGSLADAVLAEQVDFFVGEIAGDDFFLPDAYILLVAGTEQNPILILHRNARLEAENPTQVDVFFAHAAPDAPTLSIRRFDSPETLAEDLEFGAITGYTALTPTTHVLEVVDAAGEVLDVFEVNLSGRQGEAFALVIAPAEGGSPDKVAVVGLDTDGNPSASPIVTAAGDKELPERFSLHGSYPNPFNPTTSLSFDLPLAADVSVTFYDVLGRRVLELPARSMPAGFDRTMPVDGSTLASGIYLYSVSATAGSTTTTQTGRLVVLK